MEKYFGKIKESRIPLEFNGIQVNHCRNPLCENFGVPAQLYTTRGRPRKDGVRIVDSYIIQAQRKNIPQLKCLKCGKSVTIKSNQAIFEELTRISTTPIFDACTNKSCKNTTISIKESSHYQKFGKTASGYKRYRCKECGKVFSVGNPRKQQKKSYANKQLFLEIVNRSPVRCMQETVGVSATTLYRKIDWLYNKCLHFLECREQRLSSLPLPIMNISIDRQEYSTNWIDKKLKNNVNFQGIAAAENKSGYILGMFTNYDPSMNHEELEQLVAMINDNIKKPPFRRYARFWSAQDYNERIRNKYGVSAGGVTTASELYETIAEKYYVETLKEDPDSIESLGSRVQLPHKGLQVHAEYTMQAFLFYLKNRLQNVRHINFYLDQESGIRSAFSAAFADRINARSCDAFFVQIAKALSDPERRKHVAHAAKIRKMLKKYYPKKSDKEIAILAAKRNFSLMRMVGNDLWWTHPVPFKGEALKLVCRLTPPSNYESEEQAAWKYLGGTLRGVDSYFNAVRRKVHPLERGIHTASGSDGVWHGYSPYDPAMIQKYLTIHRVYYNYVKKRKKQTPAMKLGLAKGPVSVEDILYY